MFKKVGFSMYAHKSNIDEIVSKISNVNKRNLIEAVRKMNEEIGKPFVVIKVNTENGNISLIDSETWDTINEPIVGDSYCFAADGTYKVIRGGTKVYHNRWQFVSDNYIGFDIEEAKKRTETWNKIPNIKKLKSKIGNVTFWHNLLKENNLPI